MKIEIRCLNCNINFEAKKSDVDRNRAKFCTLKCANKFSGNVRKCKKENNVVCALCGHNFYLNKSKMLKSKSGLYFCCRKHKDVAQRIGSMVAIQPPHYKNAKSSYREIAFRSYEPKCNKCGYDKIIGILEVNHIDCNRENNELENLEILCPTCHREFHFETKTGIWR